MKKYRFVAIILTLVGFSTSVQAENFMTLNENLGKRQQSVEQLSQSALLAAKRSGVAEVGTISCDPSFIHCSCQGAINCAWLALACSEAGGIRGFDGDCFLPDAVPGARDAVNNFASMNAFEEASCKGIFCSCTGPKDSSDCRKIKACADEVLCVGDNCGCIGGHVD